MIAGLEDVTKGEIFIEDNKVNDIPPKDRDIAMVFQSYALYPHMTVFQNIEYPLKIKNVPKEKRKDQVLETAKKVQLEGLLKRLPKQLSGGMRKRVDLARGFAAEPEVLLMDEPFGALDIMTKEKLQEELHNLWVNNPRTIIFITHDVEEAVFLGNRVILMTPRPGKIDLVIEPNLKNNRDMSIKSEAIFFENVKKIRSRLKEY